MTPVAVKSGTDRTPPGALGAVGNVGSQSTGRSVYGTSGRPSVPSRQSGWWMTSQTWPSGSAKNP